MGMRRDFPQSCNGDVAPRLVLVINLMRGKGKLMDKISREGAARVGVDLAKRVIQVHAVDAGDRVLTNRTLVRDKFIEWCARLPAGCVIAMEASSSAHHWARKLVLLGLDARIMAAHLVTPYRRQGTSGMGCCRIRRDGGMRHPA